MKESLQTWKRICFYLIALTFVRGTALRQPFAIDAPENDALAVFFAGPCNRKI